MEDVRLIEHANDQTRVQRRFTQDFDRELLKEIGISATGKSIFAKSPVRGFTIDIFSAIDFIDRLLDKNPATRMTLTQALCHPWLLPPGTERDSESLPASLAAVNLPESSSFDSRSMRSTSNTAGPSTSATEDANEDCSYPMTNLHIRTPALDRTIQAGGADSFCSNGDNQLAGQSSFWGNQPRLSGIQLDVEDDSLSSVVPESHPISQEQPRFALFSQPARSRARSEVQAPQSLVLQESPPSPPLTDAAMEDVSSLPAFVEESPSSLPDFIDEIVPNFGTGLPVKSVNNVDAIEIPGKEAEEMVGKQTQLATPLSSSKAGSILKRKRSDNSIASQESSDLSPAPESQSNRAVTISAFIEAHETPPGVITPKANKKRVATVKAGAIPTRSSARIRATHQSSSSSNSPRTPKTTPRARKP